MMNTPILILLLLVFVGIEVGILLILAAINAAKRADSVVVPDAKKRWGNGQDDVRDL